MLNYTVHSAPISRLNATAAKSPELVAPLTGQRLALDTASAAIKGPCELRILPDETMFVDVRAVAGDLNTATSPLKLAAGVPAWFELPVGTWYIRGSAA